MARDGLLPPWAGHVHPRFRTPWMSSILVGLAVGTFAALLPIGILGQLTSIGTLFAFVIVCAGVLVLRARRPDLPRPFRAPWVPVTPLAGIAISLLLMLSLPWDTWLRLIAWLAVGLVLYFAYGSRNSRVRNGAAGRRAPAPGV
jgi:APA family basic amino acid/polyamine antiporter